MNVYKKHNSFLELRHRSKDIEWRVRERIQRLSLQLEPPDLHSKQVSIWRKAVDDLLTQAPDDGRPRFRLSPNVIEEINSFPDAVVPRYLVHRYRYEMYPQLHIIDDYPPYLQIEPTSRCNYRCVFCYETDPTFTKRSSGFMGSMSIDLFKRVVDEAQGNVEFISLASRGEPLLCPDIEAMLAYTPGKFLNLKLNTNASLLDERGCHAILQSGVKTVVFSADAAREPLYSQLRVGGKLDEVLTNIERFQRLRETRYPNRNIITRVSGVKFSDEQDLDSMEQLWGGLVDQVAFVKYNPWENTYMQPKNDLIAPCSDLWRRMFVWWDGKVNPCDVDYKSTLSVGNLLKSSLSKLWVGAEYSGLRETHLSSNRSGIEPCSRCTVV